MRGYLLRRLLQAPVVLLVLTALTFLITRVAPGGPFDSDRKMDPVVEQALNEKFHLHDPLPQQYAQTMWLFLRGELPSCKYRSRTVNEIIAVGLPTSMLLGGCALLIALAVGLGAGIFGAARHGSLFDHASMAAAMVGLSLPTFVIGPLLALCFGLWLRWLPVAGYDGPWHLTYLVLPAITLAAPFAARIARLCRAGMMETISQDYVRAARAKGLGEAAVILRHAARGGVLPVVAFLGPAAAQILTGSLVVERIFQIPGLGREFIESALNRDYTLVMGTVIVYGALLVLLNIVGDLLLAALDPRIRLG